MEIPSSGKRNRVSIRQSAIRRRSWLAAGAAAVIALSLITGCKQQASPARPSDQQLTNAIQAKIKGETALNGQNIQVSVSNGVATLSGTVPNAASRALAGNDSGSVTGVKTVVNNLTVQQQEQASATPAPEPARQAPAHHETAQQAPAHHHRAAPQQRRQASAPPPPPPPSQQQAPPPQQAQSAAASQAAMPSAAPQPVTRRVTIPAGTTVPIIMTNAMSTKTAQPNQMFHASLASDVMVHGVVAIPLGAPVLGQVIDAKEAAHFKGRSFLSLDLTQVTVYGKKIPLQTDTFNKEGKARGRNTAEKTGGGAVLGALIGALAGGGKGAAIGALAGGSAGAGVNAVTRGQEVQIPSESRIDFHLQAPVTLTVQIPPPSNQQQSNQPTLQQR